MTQIGQWQRFEGSVTNNQTYTSPYDDVTLTVTYSRPDGSEIDFWGFYDGDNTWRFRFMPDQFGEWRYNATFSDGTPGVAGSFTCVESDVPGMLSVDETNPMWFGYKGGEPVLIRSLHVGDCFFASNLPDEQRTTFLDWVSEQGYNMLSIGSHYLNRNKPGRGAGWDTPALWPLNASEYQRMETILDDLAHRHIMVFPFGGFFGRNAAFPHEVDAQEQYVRYTLARLGPYWNILFNVSGPEPLLNVEHAPEVLSKAELDRLGQLIRQLDVFGHPLTVHNKTGDDAYKDDDYCDFSTLQGPKTTDLNELSDGLLRNHHPKKPLYVQETLWSGNIHGHPDYTDEQLRRNAWVIMMSAGALNFSDNGGPEAGMLGDSSSGFTGTLNLKDRRQWRHDILKSVWDCFETFPFCTMQPRQALVSAGFALAEAGRHYLVYLPDGGTVDAAIEGGPYAVRWINARNPAETTDGGSTSDGQTLNAPNRDGGWLVWLYKDE